MYNVHQDYVNNNKAIFSKVYFKITVFRSSYYLNYFNTESGFKPLEDFSCRLIMTVFEHFPVVHDYTICVLSYPLPKRCGVVSEVF